MKNISAFLFCLLFAVSAQSQDSLLSFSDGKKWGLTDEHLIVWIKPQYDTSFWVNDRHFAIAKLNNRYGVINVKAETIIPFTYDYIYQMDDTTGVGTLNEKSILLNFKTGKTSMAYDVIRRSDSFLIVRINKKYQILNRVTAQPINKELYDDAEFFRYIKPFAIVKIANKYGVINPAKNIMVIPVRYDQINEYYSSDQIVATAGDQVHYFNDKGRLVNKTIKKKDPVYNTQINDQRVVAPPLEEEKVKDGTGIYINDLGKGNWGLSLEYWKKGIKQEVYSYNVASGYSKVEELVYYNWTKTGVLKAVKDGKVGLIDGTGKELVPCIYDDFSFDDTYFHTKKDGKAGVLSNDFKVIIPPILGRIVHYYSGHIFHVEMPDGKQGFMNGKTGKIYIPGL